MLPRIVSRQWWSAERLHDWQSEKLRQLTAHAWREVPFYRRLWNAAGISPEAVRCVADLPLLPAVAGAEFKSSPGDSLVARNIDPARHRTVHTSGSTGQPLTVHYTPSDRFTVIKAMSVRHYLAHGVGVRDMLAGFTPDRSAAHGARAWYERLGFWRRLMLHADAEPRDWIEPLRRVRPDVIAGSPMTLRALNDELRASGDTVPSPRLIFSSGARLEDEERRDFEAGLGAPVHDVYGSHEGGFIAWECPRCPGYHINADTVIVEILDENGRQVEPGGTGEIVITNLFSSAMPFIRYKLGDVVTLSADAPQCGRSLPLLKQIWGRNDDTIRLPSGRRVGPYPIYMALLGEERIREWRLVQNADASCILLIVPRETHLFACMRQDLETRMRQALGGEISVRTESVDHIERDRKSKWKTIVSSCTAASQET